MNYEEKYIKYFIKYHALRKQIGGEPAEYLYHGTSFFYIDNIIEYGLDGRYPDSLYNEMKEYSSIIKKNLLNPGGSGFVYLDGFFERQEQIRQGGRVSLSFTAKMDVAREYTGGQRIIGEGPTNFINRLGEFLEQESNNTSDIIKRMSILYDKLSIALRCLPLILAIKINDFDELKDKNITTSTWEETIYFPILPSQLYIVSPTHSRHIKLLSDDGIEYIDNQRDIQIENELERERRLTEEKEKLKDWVGTESFNKEYSHIRFYKEKYSLGITYDTYGREYIHIDISNYPKELSYVFYFDGEIKEKGNTLELTDDIIIQMNKIINRMIQHIDKSKQPKYIKLLSKTFDWYI